MSEQSADTRPVPRDFDTILVANRGEIACRVIATARRSGYRTVAVYSAADQGARHTQMADVAVAIGPTPAAESYMSIDRLIAAARATGAGAVHPGYGFLSENAAFARACEAAGVVFIGPSADAIELMGNKAAAKRHMEREGVPCLPGYAGSDPSDAAFLEAAGELGFPLMIKAAAGGGGRGMRVVTSAAQLEAALPLARAEAAGAFGSEELILERALDRPRHVEIQVLADAHGRVIHLGERDCSVQRRHQKIIEEAPCPVMTPSLREQMGTAAVRAAASIGYRGAGTVEFLLDADGGFYFMEMNTRLQVEHPVTELITGVDLVEQQIRIARNEPLEMTQDDVVLTGHAIEARLYAEDPAEDFLPAPGRLDQVFFPSGPGLRIDTGVAAGDDIPAAYDPMIAKLIAHAPDRRLALRQLRAGLAGTALFGTATNRDFLLDALGQPMMAAGDATTAFVAETYPDGGFRPTVGAEETGVAGLLLHLALSDAAARACVSDQAGLRHWGSAGSLASHYRLTGSGQDARVQIEPAGAQRFKVGVKGQILDIVVRRRDASSADLEVNGRPVSAFFHHPEARTLSLVTETISSCWRNTLGEPAGEAEQATGVLVAPMQGVVVAVDAAVGDRVAAGQRLCVLEAMKMQHEIRADADGVLARVAVRRDDQVTVGAPLFVIDSKAGDPSEDGEPVRLPQASDFRAESDALHALLEPLTDAELESVTRFKGWTLNDIVTHLHVWNLAAHLSLTDEAALGAFLAGVLEALPTGDLRRYEQQTVNGIRGRRLLEAWHTGYQTVAAAFEAADPRQRLKWAGPDMSARSAITARLMETWAHGQAAYDLLGVNRVDKDRLRNIANLGVQTFEWTFRNRGLEPPGPPPAVVLTSPSGAEWTWHEDSATGEIRGSATEFCQVVTQTRHVDDTDLSVTGETALAWLAIAQCFAGPPVDPPAPGTRYRQHDDGNRA